MMIPGPKIASVPKAISAASATINRTLNLIRKASGASKEPSTVSTRYPGIRGALESFHGGERKLCDKWERCESRPNGPRSIPTTP